MHTSTRTPRVRRSLAGALAAATIALALVGCSDDAETAEPTLTPTPAATAVSPTPTPTVAVSPTPTATPTPTPTLTPTSEPVTPTPAPQPASTPAPAPTAPPATTTPAPTAAPTQPPSTPTAAPTPTGPSSVTVEIRGFGFPWELEVGAGARVTWINRDEAPHDVVAYDGSFRSPVMGKDQSWSRTFDTPGTYAYFCEVHPYMQASVIVR